MKMWLRRQTKIPAKMPVTAQKRSVNLFRTSFMHQFRFYRTLILVRLIFKNVWFFCFRFVFGCCCWWCFLREKERERGGERETRTHAHTHTYTHARKRTCTHTHTNTHTHTHTHTDHTKAGTHANTYSQKHAHSH